MVQLSHPYMTTGKTIALTILTFVVKVLFLLFNMLSTLVIAFLPRRKHLLISWLQSPSAVIWKPKKVKVLTVFIVSPSICHEVMGPDAMILVFWVLSFKQAFSMFSLIYLLKPLFMLLSAPGCSDPSPCPSLGVGYHQETPHFISQVFSSWVSSHTIFMGHPNLYRHA